jgi:hypothetical protein
MRDVRVSLSLPSEGYIVSGTNPVIIGDMNQGTQRTIFWTIAFSATGYFDVGVTASGNRMDGGGQEITYGYTSVNISERLVISLYSPLNVTYSRNQLPLNFSLNKPAAWIGYSLNGESNITITENTTLTDLPDNQHHLTLYANDTLGNMEEADVFFTIDTTPPTISILSPLSYEYNNSMVGLDFTLNEAVSTITYTLDNNPNIPITGNITLTDLSNGVHEVTVYATDLVGNFGSSNTAFFRIQDSTPPNISVLSPENTSYHIISIPLTFTVNEPVSAIRYRLDAQGNVTITGNMTLNDLAEGMHNITIYANDIAGNWAGSQIAYFSFEKVHDVAAVNLTNSRIAYLPTSVVGQGYNITIYVNLVNQGSFEENFLAEIYANSSLLGEAQANLSSGQGCIVELTWTTEEPALGIYSLSVQIPPLQNETDLEDNTFTAPIDVLVTIPGDVDGDRDVDIFDVVLVVDLYGVTSLDPQYDICCDIEGDGDTDIFDVVITADNYGSSW